MTAEVRIATEGSRFDESEQDTSIDLELNVNRANNDQPAWSRRVAADIVAFLDAFAILISAGLTASFFSISGDIPFQTGQLLQIALITAFIANIGFRAQNFYDDRTVHRMRVRLGPIIISLIVAFLASFGLSLQVDDYSREMLQWYLVWLAISTGLVFSFRNVAAKTLHNYAVAGRFDQRICVYGAGSIARRVYDYLEIGPAGLTFVGLYDDRTGKNRVNDHGLTVTGSLDDLIEAGRNGQIDQIIIALPQTADRRMAEISRRLEQLPVSLHVVTHMAPDLVDPAATHKVSTLGPLGLLDVKSNPQADWAPIVKRVEDIVLGGLLLAICAPLMAAIAIAIKAGSHGPVLFRQRRRGFNKKTIEVLKFRTMHVQEDDAHVRQAGENDDRITPIGKWLRRSSLDELPQLWNVIVGDMSLVGPRPHALVHDDAWSQEISRYANRAQVKPGITGLAQVNGERGPVNRSGALRRRVDQDLDYIANWSVWLDLKILSLTVWAVISGRNAL